MKRSKFYYLTHPSVGIPALLAKVSDRYALKQQWKSRRGTDLDLKHPNKLSEKLQWLKLYDRKSLYTTLVDKYRAKLWLEESFGCEHIIPTLFVYQNAYDIDITALPKSFVLKCNHDSGSVFICHDKSKDVYLDKHMHAYKLEQVKQILNDALGKNYWRNSMEWPYKNVKPCIICEKIMLQSDGTLPNDYKLFYINGVFEFAYVSYDREGVNDRCTYDREWKRLPFVYVEEWTYNDKMNTSDVPCPASFKDMLEYGEKIAKHFKFVRVDFYDVDGKMYFGEITPFHSGGFSKFFPEKYDNIYGEKLILD